MHHGGASLNETPCSLPNVHQLPTAGAEPHQLLDEQTSKVRQQVATSEAMLPNKMFVCCHNLSITDATSSSEAKLTSTSCSSRHCQSQHGTWSSRQTHNPQGSPSVLGDCMYVNIQPPAPSRYVDSPLLLHQGNHLLLRLLHQHHPQENPSAPPSFCAFLLHTIASSGDYLLIVTKCLSHFLAFLGNHPARAIYISYTVQYTHKLYKIIIKIGY